MPESRLLLVSYLFPPSGGVGVQRALSYARYLPLTGCRVFVLTARNAAAPVSDPGLVRLIPQGLPLYRSFTPEIPYAWRDRIWKRMGGQRSNAPAGDAAQQAAQRPSLVQTLTAPLRSAIHHILCPDPQVVWVPGAIRAAARIIRRDRIDTVLISVPPFSALRIGVALKRRFPHIRLMSDFRDEWIGYYLAHLDAEASDYKRAVSIRQEREAIEASDYIVSVTPSQTASIRARYPEIPESRFLTSPNGYDPESLKDFRSRPHNTGKLVLTYMGTIYNNRVYSPAPLLDAIDSLPEEIGSQFLCRFIGRVSRDAEPIFQGRRCQLEMLGFRPQAEGFRLMEETDYLLLVVGNPTALAGKMFEYLATGKPVLAITPPGSETERIVTSARAGACAGPDDPAAIRAMLLEAWERFREHRPPSPPDAEVVGAYSRQRTVAALAEAAGLGSASR